MGVVYAVVMEVPEARCWVIAFVDPGEEGEDGMGSNRPFQT